MAYMNQQGYIEIRKGHRSWFLIKYASLSHQKKLAPNHDRGELFMGNTASRILFPKNMIGKRIRLKVEVLSDNNTETMTDEECKQMQQEIDQDIAKEEKAMQEWEQLTPEQKKERMETWMKQ